ncbi:uncharacterized protein B0T23DRAFT_13154 [Neurospora hispaniola]|uniref:Uncharacterized protein n=1 Tax=Neurospora hispaniola TaxID=588809 RepID=A0AAJ0MV29_9PEZI|nr:hypothetical protein B0T23DRAFT_13154 [Neurospora hispaniola]
MAERVDEMLGCYKCTARYATFCWGWSWQISSTIPRFTHRFFRSWFIGTLPRFKPLLYELGIFLFIRQLSPLPASFHTHHTQPEIKDTICTTNRFLCRHNCIHYYCVQHVGATSFVSQPCPWGVRVRPNRSPRGDIPSKGQTRVKQHTFLSWDWVGWINGGKGGKPKLQATEPPSHSEARPITMARDLYVYCTVPHSPIATDIGRPLPFSLTSLPSQPTAAASFEQPCPNPESKASTYLRSNEQRNMVRWREEKKRRATS